MKFKALKRINRIYIVALGVAFCLMASCKKFVEVPPPSTELTEISVFSDNADASAAMAGIYSVMQTNSLGGGADGISILPGLSADEVALFPDPYAQLQTEAYTNNLLATTFLPIWGDCYSVIYQTNAAISGVQTSAGMTTPIKNQFLGEALFVRAYCYFYLVNLYGGVPLVLSTNYQNTQSLARSSQAMIYQQIIVDLKQAQGLLTDNYLNGSGQSSSERVRPNLEAVNALLARTYLYTDDWNDAATVSAKVISSGLYTLQTNLDNVFSANSQEAIWQLEVPSNSYYNTNDGEVFLEPLLGIDGAGPSAAGSPYYMSNTLVQSFEKGDLRRSEWVDSVIANNTVYYYPYKYQQLNPGPPPTEYPMMLRYAEQYLILSEANLHLGATSQAVNNLNVIRNRAGLPNYAGATDTASVMTAIMHERQVELFTENGHRWLDLKRTGLVRSVMGTPGNQCAFKGGTWTSAAQLYPIPNSEIQADHNLTQNPGYH
jgi:hypothetical protein